MSRIIGIDLGTSTCEVSCVIDGKPVIIPNTLDKPVTPSVVHIGEDGQTLVGEPAAEYLLTRPDCTFMEVKRMTGSGAVLRAHGKEYAPEDIQAILLKYLVSCAEEYLNEKIDGAVITVPAYFTDAQRRATSRAGELAGIDVKRIINEPTAAALDYGLMNLKECKNILVYDFGGGTLDVTVMEMFEGVIDVKASAGDNRLGGKDFDEIIMKKLYDGGDARAQMRLKKAAEECKIALSDGESHRVSLPFLMAGHGGKPISVEKTVTRGEFETWINEMVESTKKPVLTALSDAKMSPGDLDIVLLVGGSTRIPLVRRMVEETLGVSPKTHVDPELAVARGAAVQAAILEGRLSGDQGIVLTDVCPYTLGIAAIHSGFTERRLMFSPIIPRNVTIPTEMANIYYPSADYQTMANIEVYQGESTDLANNERLGEVTLTGIPPARKGKEPLEVIFAYDVNGILQVKARVVSNNKSVQAEISTAGVKPKPAIDTSGWDKSANARLYRPAVHKAEKLILAGDEAAEELQMLVRSIKEAIVQNDESRAEELREELLELIEIAEALNE